ncbi:hypothetical protein [Burkholderia sp. AU16741]|uniref:hypothetical protein n=1 Tax=Burkholderia sp. AU16741 TaxID=2015347 RepID=UPI00117F957C|nr:hypothetical protein [Burkholderia sp. AU16741]
MNFGIGDDFSRRLMNAHSPSPHGDRTHERGAAVPASRLVRRQHNARFGIGDTRSVTACDGAEIESAEKRREVVPHA